jgi:hypothetical protein
MPSAKASLFPLIVRRSAGHAVADLGRDVSVALVNGRARAPRTYFRADLEAFGVDPAAAYLDARENIAALFRSGIIRGRHLSGPAGSRVLAVRHPLAASCIVMPGLWQWARQELGHDALCASIPLRDALVIFADEGPSYREEIRAQLAGPFAHKMLTTEIFGLDACGVRAFDEPYEEIPVICDTTVVMDGPTLDSALQRLHDLANDRDTLPLARLFPLLDRRVS